VTNALRLFVRWLCILAVSFTASYALLHVARRTSWFKERVYHELLSGTEDQRLRAASILADVGGESQLLRGLKSPDATISDMARRGLDHLWFSAAGNKAYEQMEKAYALAEEKKFAASVTILDQILERYPNYVEALNRRAASLWQLGEYEKSRTDCENALALNPNHYGAWEGLGVSQLQLGDLEGACRSLRTALSIFPNDSIARRCLKKIDDLQHGRRTSTPKLDSDLL